MNDKVLVERKCFECGGEFTCLKDSHQGVCQDCLDWFDPPEEDENYEYGEEDEDW